MNTNISKEEYIKALEKLKNQDSDIFGVLGDLGALGLGGAGGAVAAPIIAGLFGATELLGSTWLAGVLGGIFVATTPIGWVIGSAAVGGALAYGIAQLVRSGATSDTHRERDIEVITQRIAGFEQKANASNVTGAKFKNLIESIQILVENDILSHQKSNELIIGVQSGRISFDFAFQAINELIKQYRIELGRFRQGYNS